MYLPQEPSLVGVIARGALKGGDQRFDMWSSTLYGIVNGLVRELLEKNDVFPHASATLEGISLVLGSSVLRLTRIFWDLEKELFFAVATLAQHFFCEIMACSSPKGDETAQ